jgi:periplasmic protein TonB
MKATLREFMPYGAPELIEARPTYQARALALASATALAVYGVLMGLGLVIHDREITEIDPGALAHRVIDLQPKQQVLPPPVAPVTPTRNVDPAVQPKIAVPVPVPDTQPTSDFPSATTPVATDGDPRAVPGTQAVPQADPVPEFGKWIAVDQLPQPLNEVKPVYDELPKAAGVSGTVLVRVLVGKDGRVMDARVDDKIQVPMLNEAALAAARQWLFTPATTNDRPVMCWVAIPFRFSLH